MVIVVRQRFLEKLHSLPQNFGSLYGCARSDASGKPTGELFLVYLGSRQTFSSQPPLKPQDFNEPIPALWPFRRLRHNRSRDPSWEITIWLWFFQPTSSVVHFLSGWPSSTHSVGQVFFPASACGAPQGSVLGPVLFSLYISPLEYEIKALVLNAIVYADGSQLYIIMRQSRRSPALQDLTLCNQDTMSQAPKSQARVFSQHPKWVITLVNP